MSIIKVEVRSVQGDLLTLTLDDISNGYVVEEIEGLDPVKASIASSNFAMMDGQQYHSSSLDLRNIRITLSFAPEYSEGETVRELRNRLYRFFMPKSAVNLKIFMEDGLVVTTSGRVESCEAPLFVQEPMLVCSVLCFDPDFIDDEEITIESFLTTDTTPTPVDITGTVNTGMYVSLRAYSAMSDFTIYHTSSSGVATSMQFSIPLILNDLVVINTNPGEKSITMTRGSVTTSAMYAISPQSGWIQLDPGVNLLRIAASPLTASPVYVTYRNRYGGL